MHTEIVKQINQLPITERVEIIEEVSRGVRLDLRNSNGASESQDAAREKRREAIRRLRGIAKVEGKPAPTDEEVKQDYYDYLAEKYK